MKTKLTALMLVLAMLMAGCSAFANETEGQTAKDNADAASGVVLMEAGEERTASGAFDDVPADSYCADAVNWAVKEGITNGLSDTTFGPEIECNRAQVVTFLWRLAGMPATSGESTFTDVPAGKWYADAVLWAVGENITNGLSATTFGPDVVCNRAQVVTFLWRMAGQPAASGKNVFEDVKSDSWCSDAVVWAVEKGITKGLSANTFGPEQNCNRAQTVTFLYRYAQNLDKVPEETVPTEPPVIEPPVTEPPETEPEEPTEDPNMGEWA